MTDAGREPELDVDEPACGLGFLTEACCPDGDDWLGGHECWLHKSHAGACECDCGTVDVEGYDEAVREWNDDHGIPNMRAIR